MPKRVKPRSVTEQKEIEFEAFSVETGFFLATIYNLKQGKIIPGHPWLNPTADRKQIRVTPRGKGTPRRERKYHTRDIPSQYDIITGAVDPINRGELPKHLVEYENQGCLQKGEITSPAQEPLPEETTYQTIPVPITYGCGHTELQTFELKPGLTLSKILEVDRSEMKCSDCWAIDRKEHGKEDVKGWDLYNM